MIQVLLAGCNDLRHLKKAIGLNPYLQIMLNEYKESQIMFKD